MILLTVNIEMFSLALGELAKEVGAGKERRMCYLTDYRGALTML